MGLTMGLTDQEVEIIVRMMDFCEENWVSFTNRCEEAGLDPAHVDLTVESIRTHITEG